MKPLLSLLALVAFSSGASRAHADVKLSDIFTDNMVLQRDRAVPIWGTADADERVKVELAGQSKQTQADAQGHWLLRLKPLKVATGLTLKVTGKNALALDNVAVGDVYLCSGQSNMQMAVGGVNNAGAEIAAANYPGIRFFTVPWKVAGQPQREWNGQSRWEICSPQNVGGFSAVGYFFGRKLHQELKIPIGLIDASWGGTIAEAWTSRDTIAAMPEYKDNLAAMDAAAGAPSDLSERMSDWWAQNDPGSKGEAFAQTEASDGDWKEMTLPANWESAGLPDYDGIVWFRKTVDVPASWAGQDVTLHLGTIDDRDTTFFNGAQVGADNSWSDLRHYKVAGNLVKPGANVIAVRVLDNSGNGGISGGEKLRIENGAGQSISLEGPWKYRDTRLASQLTAVPTDFSGNPNQATVLYNGMIAPLVPTALRGVLWYQGESNAASAARYRTLLPALIRDWRGHFGQEFGFYLVQLANFHPHSPQPQESQWAELREAQTMALALPHTGMATIIDTGEANNIHPKNKQEVGLRLALAALAGEYGQKIEFSGPLLNSVKPVGHTVRVTFSHAAGLKTRDGLAPREFAIAGADKKWVWAQAVIEGEVVVLSNDAVPLPTQVRYAWADNPDVNLTNSANLPAVPFRTDRP